MTDHYTKRLRNFCGDEFVPIEFARKLERELSAVTEQRDRLVEVLNDLWHNYSLTGAAYELIEKALAAVKGEHQ